MANIFQVTEPEVKKVGKGWNVKHITRVTGYFGYTENFGPGKVAELKDRHREDDNKVGGYFNWYKGGSSEN